ATWAHTVRDVPFGMTAIAVQIVDATGEPVTSERIIKIIRNGDTVPAEFDFDIINQRLIGIGARRIYTSIVDLNLASGEWLQVDWLLNSTVDSSESCYKG